MTSDENVDVALLYRARLEYAARTAMDSMPPDIKAEALVWCVTNNDDAIRQYRRGDGSVVLWWGGGVLAVIDADALTEKSLTQHGLDGDAIEP